MQTQRCRPHDATRHDRTRADGRQHGAAPDRPTVTSASSTTSAAEPIDELAGEGATPAHVAGGSGRRARSASQHLGDDPGGVRRRHRRPTGPAAVDRATRSSTAATRGTATTSTAAGRCSTERGIHYVDVGTSGGVHGLERGYCLMIGGDDRGRRPTRADLRHARARRRRRRAHAGPHRRPVARRGAGLAALRPARCRPLREDGPQRDRVRPDGRLRRGTQRARQGRTSVPTTTPPTPRRLRSTMPSTTSTTSIWPRSPRCGGAGRWSRSWLLDLTAEAFARRSDARRVRRPRQRLRRGPLDDPRRDRRGRAGTRAVGGAVPTVQLTGPIRHRRQGALGDARRFRRPPRTHGLEPMMLARQLANRRADALVLFGATGDLAKRKLFPALYHLERTGQLDSPGDRRRPQRLDRRDVPRRHARESIIAADSHADAAVIDPLMQRLDLIQGDYADQATWNELRDTLDRTASCNAVYYMAIPPSMFPEVAERLASVGLNERGRIVVEKPFGRDLASAERAEHDAGTRCSRRNTSSASITTSARRASRICSCSGSRTRCSSRSGTVGTCAACRSRCRRRSGSRDAGRSTTASARSATCSRTTCCRSSPCWRWNRRPVPTPSSCRTRRPR